MLGDISPQSVKIDSSAVVYPGRNHVTALSVKKFDGSRYVAADVSLLTRVVLVFPQLDPVVAFDSSVTAGVFTWSGSTITVDLSDFSMPASIQQSYLIVYDAQHTSGQVLVDDNSSVLEWDFRNISAAGIVQPPVVELVGEAPANGLLYGRRDGVWVQIDAVVAGVTSVNGETGTVLLNTDDVPEGVLNLYFTNARASAAAPVQSVNGQTGVVVLSAANVGADPAGTAAAAVAAHVADTTPHDVITQIDRAGFDLTAGLTAGVGELVWNATDGTLDLGLPGGVTLQTGQEFLVRGLNNSGTTMTNMTAVYISGAQGNRVVFTRAQANVIIAERTIGLLTQDITNNQEGFCTLAGLVRNINTSAWAEGAPLWLSATVAGGITDITPPSPNRSILVGFVVRSHATQGSVFVRVNSTGSLAALHDVNIIAPQDNDILVYNAATSTWLNEPNTGGSGEANTASNLGSGAGVFAQKVGVDLQFKSLVAGTNVTLTPTGNSITIAAAGGGGGSVTSVNGQTGAVVLTTTDIAEGTNLYFTNARASAAAPVQTVDGQTGTVNLTGSYAALSHVGSGGTSHANATTSVAGFMSAADKTKLDGVATNANNYVHPNHSGDVTSVGDGAQTIAANAVTNAKAADMAVNTIKGRITAGTGDPEDLTATQVRTIINVANGATANQTDAFLLARANHTGAQTASTISDFSEAVDDRVAALVVAGPGISSTYDDGANTLTVTNTGRADVLLTPAISSGTLTIDLTVPAWYRVTLNQNVTTITFTNFPSGRVPVFAIEFVQDATGGRTVAFPGSVVADDGGSIPAPATAANAATVYTFSSSDGGTTYKLASGVENGFTVSVGAINEAPLTTIASAATVNLAASTSNTINVSGTTTITSLGTMAAGATRRLIFQGALTLTHNATSLILPGGANITTAAGDAAEFVSLGSGNWKCYTFERANGTSVSLGPTSSPTFASLTLSNGQIAFPATTVPSADANTLDDYEEGTWTPVLTFATPGDLSVAYSTQAGSYTKIGRQVMVSFFCRDKYVRTYHGFW